MATNAFIGKPKKPTRKDLTTALGPSHLLWDQLLSTLADQLGVDDQQWNCYSVKAGWALKVKRGERTILYLSPRRNCFLASFALGDKAVKAALATNLPASILKLIREAKRYAEGTAVRIEVKSASDLPVIMKLAELKLAN
jgi:uncharacterized protein DUF3788